MALDLEDKNFNFKRNKVTIIDAEGAELNFNAAGNLEVEFPSAQDVEIKNTGAISVDASGSTVPISAAADLNVSIQNASLSVAQTASDWDIENLNLIANTNLVEGFAIDTYTLNHTATHSIINFMDLSTDTYLLWSSREKDDTTTTLILDFGSIETFHSIILNYTIQISAACDVGEADMTFFYSSNKTDWTEISSVEYTETGTEIDADVDAYGEELTFRYLRITLRTNETGTGSGQYKQMGIKRLLVSK